MNPFALSLTLASAAMHGTRDFVTKQASDKEVFILWYELVAVLISAPLAAFVLFRYGLPAAASFLWCIPSSLCHVLYWICMAKALQKADLSLAYPIMRASPALVLLLAVLFLDERVSLLASAGVCAVVFGIYFLHVEELTGTALTAPLRALLTNSGTRWAFATMVFVAFYSVIDKQGVAVLNPALYIFCINLAALVLYASYLLPSRSKAALYGELDGRKGAIMGNGVLLIASYLLILVAYGFERVSYIQAVRQISILVALLLSKQLLNERNWKTRAVGGTLITGGTAIIALA